MQPGGCGGKGPQAPVPPTEFTAESINNSWALKAQNYDAIYIQVQGIRMLPQGASYLKPAAGLKRPAGPGFIVWYTINYRAFYFSLRGSGEK